MAISCYSGHFPEVTEGESNSARLIRVAAPWLSPPLAQTESKNLFQSDKKVPSEVENELFNQVIMFYE